MTLSLTDRALLVTSLSVYSVIGTTGNTLILLVYHRKTETFMFTSFIRLLGIIDLLVCAMVIPYTLTFELHYVSDEFSCRFFELIRHFTIFASSLTLVAIAVERYYAVCRPLNKLNEEQIAKGVAVISIFSIISSVPAVFMFTVSPPNDGHSPVNHTERNDEEYCHFTTEYLGETGTRLYQGFLIVTFFGAILILSVFYCLVYAAVLKRSKLWFTNRIAPVVSPKSVTLAPTTIKTTVNENGDPAINAIPLSLRNQSSLVVPNTIYSPSAIPRRDCLNNNQRIRHASTNMESNPTRSTSIEVKNGFQVHPTGKLHTFDKASRNRHKTATMLFVCTLVFIIAWIPFWLDIFNITQSVPFRFQFFISYASNPLIYGLVNREIRNSISSLMRECLSYVYFFG